MNFHSKLTGALDAVILGLSGLLTITLVLALMNPAVSDSATVDVQALPALTDDAAARTMHL